MIPVDRKVGGVFLPRHFKRGVIMPIDILGISLNTVTYGGLRIPSVIIDIDDTYTPGSNAIRNNGENLTNLQFSQLLFSKLGGAVYGAGIRIKKSGSASLFPTADYVNGSQKLSIINYSSSSVVSIWVRGFFYDSNQTEYEVAHTYDVRGLGDYCYSPIIFWRVKGDNNRFIYHTKTRNPEVYVKSPTGLGLAESQPFPVAYQDGTYTIHAGAGSNAAQLSIEGELTAKSIAYGDTDPYNDLPVPGDDPIPGGGGVSVPGFPGLTATSAGVIGLFCPSAAQMQLLSDFMWTDFGGTGSTVEDILKELVEAVKRTISNPLDYIIGLNIIPSQGLSIGASKIVRFGFVSSGVSMPVLADQYFTVDCGSLTFDTLCGNTFLDYAPYSKFSIYLPYIGFKDVDPNDFVGHTIGVVYHGDCVTGGITAYVTKDGSVMYQYSGCCALNVPLSSDSWGETISGAINVATGIVAAAASGGAAGVGLAAAKGAASVAANPSLLSPQVSHSGAVSGGAGCMGVQYPFVIREAVNYHSTSNFNKESGYPAYYYKKFSDVTGFTTVLDPHVGNIENATREELDEIERLLESGVIL